MIYSYKIHVINRDLNLDATYKNVVQVFNPLTRTKDYSSVFTSNELTFTDADIEINFDINDGINSSVVLDTEDALDETPHVFKQFGVYSISATEATNRQYCIIQELTKNDNLEIINTKLYFYFITGRSIRNGNIIKYNLQLDAFMTYPLFSDIQVNKTRILRAHVNRFNLGATASSATYNFNNKYLQTGEPYDDKFIKVVKDVKNVMFKSYPEITAAAGSESINTEYIKDILNRTLWLYVETREQPNTNKLHFAPLLPEFVNFNDGTGNHTNIKIGVCCQGNITDSDKHSRFFSSDVLYGQFAENTNVINAFWSPFSPFPTMSDTTQFSIVYDYNKTAGNDHVYIYFNLKQYVSFGSNNESRIFYYEDLRRRELNNIIFNVSSQYYSGGVENSKFIFRYDSEDIELFEKTNSYINAPYDYNQIKKAEIKTKIRQTYNEYNIKNSLTEDTLKIDLNYLKTNKISLNAFMNKSVITNGDVFLTYNELFDKNIGEFIKTKSTPQFYSDVYKEYIATHNNYALTGIALPIIKSTLGSAVAAGFKGGGAGAVAGAIAGLTIGVIQTMANYDDMKNSPDNVKRKGEDLNLSVFVDEYPFEIEQTELREEELKDVNLYLYENGYAINDIENLENFFTRSSFNYIQTENCEKDLHALINKNVLDVIIKALNDGVRFWTPTHYANSKFDYTTNNLENALNA